MSPSNTSQCPHCDGEINAEATRCKHCKESVAPILHSSAGAELPKDSIQYAEVGENSSKQAQNSDDRQLNSSGSPDEPSFFQTLLKSKLKIVVAAVLVLAFMTIILMARSGSSDTNGLVALPAGELDKVFLCEKTPCTLNVNGSEWTVSQLVPKGMMPIPLRRPIQSVGMVLYPGQRPPVFESNTYTIFFSREWKDMELIDDAILKKSIRKQDRIFRLISGTDKKDCPKFASCEIIAVLHKTVALSGMIATLKI